jgi:hypothetical protein
MSIATEHDDGIVIDAHLAALVPPLTPAERASQEKRLLSQGCTEPMVVWGRLLVDGHHALAICRTYQIPFRVVARPFANRAEAEAYIAEVQLCRHSLSPHAASYLRGKRYLAEKEPHGGDRRSRSRFQDGTLRTRERLAVEYRVSDATIMRDAEFATLVDLIAGNCGPMAVQAILARAGELGRCNVKLLAHCLPREQQQFCRMLLAGGELPKLTVPAKRETFDVAFRVPLRAEAVAQRLLDQMGKPMGIEVAHQLLFLVGEGIPTGIIAHAKTQTNPSQENHLYEPGT